MRTIPLAVVLVLGFGAPAGAQTAPPSVPAGAGPIAGAMLEPMALEQRLADDVATAGAPRPADWRNAD